MKTISLLTILLLSTLSFTQTSIISLKSHGGDIENLLTEPDNFGWFEPAPVVEKVTLISEVCIVVKSESYNGDVVEDTICDDPYLSENNYSLESAMAKYGKNAKYKGFKKPDDQDDRSENFWLNGSPFQNGTNGLFALIILSYLFYLVIPIFKKR